MLRMLALIVPLMAGVTGAAQAQAPYPNRPIRVVIPFGPGGFADITMRLVGQQLSERSGVQDVERAWNRKATKAAIRFLRYRWAVTKAVFRSMSVPSTDAESSMPQCAVTGWPGQYGQASPAAEAEFCMSDQKVCIKVLDRFAVAGP